MSDFITANGLARKRLSDIQTELNARLTASFGSDINLEEDSVFSQLRDAVAVSEAELWELFQEVYDSLSPSRSEGQSLDDNCELVGVVRKAALPSTVRLSITGDDNTILSETFRASVVTTNEQFKPETAVTISAGSATEAVISVPVVANGATYTVSINGGEYTYVSDGSATAPEISAGLVSALAGEPLINATDLTGTFSIDTIDVFAPVSVSLTNNLGFDSVTTVATFESVNTGAIEAVTGALTNIDTPIVGLDSLTNKEDASLGNDRETDTELRLRRSQVVGKIGSSSVEAILAQLLNVDNIVNVKVYENFTNITDALGLPPHSIAAVAEGGTDLDVATAIFNAKPAGIDMFGTTVVAVEDVQGFSHDIKFERPTEVDIYITVTVNKFSNYPTNGDDLIKAALVQFGADNYTSGDDVIYSDLYTPINSIDGFEVTLLEIGTAPSPTGTTTIAIGAFDLANIDTANIVVTV